MTQDCDERYLYRLKDICECSVQQQLAVLEIRNQPGVKQCMYTDHDIDVNEHLSWLATLVNNEQQKVFAVLKNDQPVGVVSVNDIDLKHSKADFAIYLDEPERVLLAVPLEFTLINYVFDHLELQKLNCQVLDSNTTVVKLHQRFGFIEEGYLRSNISKDDSRVGVYYLGLTREDWLVHAPEVKKIVDKMSDNLSIVFVEESPKAETTVLDQIRNTRAKNNINWMSLLQLCVEHHPQTAKPIIAQILRLDREISDLTAQLVKQ